MEVRKSSEAPAPPSAGQTASPRWFEVLGASLRLGLTSFGGPIAHLGYFRDEYVVRRRWLDESTYADLVALCQFLPGPASSQVGIAIGLLRAGYIGALAAWSGFTLPSAIALVLFAYGVDALGGRLGTGWLHGLKVVAVAVVAQAVLGMMRSLARTVNGQRLLWLLPLLCRLCQAHGVRSALLFSVVPSALRF